MVKQVASRKSSNETCETSSLEIELMFADLLVPEPPRITLAPIDPSFNIDLSFDEFQLEEDPIRHKSHSLSQKSKSKPIRKAEERKASMIDH